MGFKKVVSFFLVMLLLSACASYKGATLSTLQPEFAPYAEKQDDITLAVKAFTPEDCKRFFDRDIIEKGYQPVQLTINNNTNKYLLFSQQGISLPCASAQEVAEKCHTSTVGRSTAYGVAGLLIWPLLIPAVVDGVKSSNANESLDRDFEAKTSDQAVIQPYVTHNGIIFIPTSSYQNAFQVTLVDRETKQKYSYAVKGL